MKGPVAVKGPEVKNYNKQKPSQNRLRWFFCTGLKDTIRYCFGEFDYFTMAAMAGSVMNFANSRSFNAFAA